MILGTLKRVKTNSKPEPTRKFSKIQENTVAKVTIGETTPNSGATMFAKGDVVTNGGKNNFLLECKTKTTLSDSITIKKDWFDKNKQECLLTGTPHEAIVFNFGPNEPNHYIIDEYLFLALKEYLDSLQETI